MICWDSRGAQGPLVNTPPEIYAHRNYFRSGFHAEDKSC